MTATKTKDRLVTPEEACERLSLPVKDPKRTIREMGRRGAIQIRYVGKFLRVCESSVDAIIDGSAK